MAVRKDITGMAVLAWMISSFTWFLRNFGCENVAWSKIQ